MGRHDIDKSMQRKPQSCPISLAFACVWLLSFSRNPSSTGLAQEEPTTEHGQAQTPEDAIPAPTTTEEGILNR